MARLRRKLIKGFLMCLRHISSPIGQAKCLASLLHKINLDAHLGNLSSWSIEGVIIVAI